MSATNPLNPAPPANPIFNVPNKISSARLMLACLLFVAIPFHHYWIAFGLFVVAAGTDWIDGWYARKYNQVTQLGRILDPFCDKILICGAYILLAVEMRTLFPWYMQIAGWMAVVVVGRELLVTVLRSLIEGSGGDFSAKLSGKLKMVFQCVAVGACLVALAMNQSDRTQMLPTWLTATVIISVWLSIVSTLHSGYLYVLNAKQWITGTSSGDSNV